MRIDKKKVSNFFQICKWPSHWKEKSRNLFILIVEKELKINRKKQIQKF